MNNGYERGFRFDLLKLSSESLPTIMEDGTPLIDGSTCYEVDTGKFYIYYKNNWYEQGAEENTQDDSEQEETPESEGGDN